jgi:hypothetical protein
MMLPPSSGPRARIAICTWQRHEHAGFAAFLRAAQQDLDPQEGLAGAGAAAD